MQVYISIDMEGVAGIATWNQVQRGTDDYPASRLLMTWEANAAVVGAFKGGATRVVVNDSHGDMTNLLPEELDPRAELILGSPKVGYSMVEGIGDQFDVALFVGYHAAAGVAAGVLAHTYSRAFYQVRLSGQPMTEAELNALVAATHGVPVGMVTGDDKICELAEKRFPGVRTVTVKRGYSSSVAAGLHPARAREAIQAAAAEAVAAADHLKPVEIVGPFVMEADLAEVPMAELCELVPGVERVAGRTVRFTSADYLEAFRCLRAWLYLASVPSRG